MWVGRGWRGVRTCAKEPAGGRVERGADRTKEVSSGIEKRKKRNDGGGGARGQGVRIERPLCPAKHRPSSSREAPLFSVVKRKSACC